MSFRALMGTSSGQKKTNGIFATKCTKFSIMLALIDMAEKEKYNLQNDKATNNTIYGI